MKYTRVTGHSYIATADDDFLVSGCNLRDGVPLHIRQADNMRRFDRANNAICGRIVR